MRRCRVVLVAALLTALPACDSSKPSAGRGVEEDLKITDEWVLGWLDQASAALARVAASDPARARMQALCAGVWTYAGYPQGGDRVRAQAAADQRDAVRTSQAVAMLRLGQYKRALSLMEPLDEPTRDRAVGLALTYLVQDGNIKEAAALALRLPNDGRLRSVADKAARVRQMGLARELARKVSDPVERAMAEYSIAIMAMVDTPDADWPKPDKALADSRFRSFYRPSGYVVSFAKVGAVGLARRALDTVQNPARQSLGWSQVAQALHERGDDAAAQQALAKAEELINTYRARPGVAVPGSHQYGRIAKTAAAMGEHDFARRILRDQETRFTESIGAWVHLGEIGQAIIVFDRHKTDRTAETARLGYAELAIVQSMLNAGRLKELDDLIRRQETKRRFAMASLAAEQRITALRRQDE